MGEYQLNIALQRAPAEIWNGICLIKTLTMFWGSRLVVKDPIKVFGEGGALVHAGFPLW